MQNQLGFKAGIQETQKQGDPILERRNNIRKLVRYKDLSQSTSALSPVAPQLNPSISPQS